MPLHLDTLARPSPLSLSAATAPYGFATEGPHAAGSRAPRDTQAQAQIFADATDTLELGAPFSRSSDGSRSVCIGWRRNTDASKVFVVKSFARTEPAENDDAQTRRARLRAAREAQFYAFNQTPLQLLGTQSLPHADLLLFAAGAGDVAHLADALRAHAPQLLPALSVYVGMQIGAALTHLENTGVAHGDVTPGNIFVAGPLRFVLGDFGEAAFVGTALHTQVCGTYGFLAPERVWDDTKTGEEALADRFGFAATLCALATGEPLLSSRSRRRDSDGSPRAQRRAMRYQMLTFEFEAARLQLATSAHLQLQVSPTAEFETQYLSRLQAVGNVAVLQPMFADLLAQLSFCPEQRPPLLQITQHCAAAVAGLPKPTSTRLAEYTLARAHAFWQSVPMPPAWEIAHRRAHDHATD